MQSAQQVAPITYKADVAITEPYVFVVIDTGTGTCKLPTTASDREAVLGIAQATALAGKAVAVTTVGTSYLKMDGTCNRGDFLMAQVTGNTGRGLAAVAPTPPVDAVGPTAAEINLVRDYVNSVQTFNKRINARAGEAAPDAGGDLIVVTLAPLGSAI